MSNIKSLVVQKKNIREFELINLFSKKSFIKNDSSIIIPSGDDAFVGKIGNYKIIITTDTLTQNTDFNLLWYKKKFFRNIIPRFDISQLGIKLSRVNLTDFFAMGRSKPFWAVANFTINGELSKSEIIKIFFSMRDELLRYGCYIVGGDISKGKEISLTLTLVGLLKNKKPITRFGFNFDDYICVSGTLGDAALGLELLENPDSKIFSREKETVAYLLKRHLYPDVRYDIVQKLSVNFTSLTDLSDGLIKALEIMVNKRKDISLEIDVNKLPISKEIYLVSNIMGFDYIKKALIGGEDFEYLFTVRSKDIGKILNNKNISVIGRVLKRSKKRILLKNAGSIKNLKGFEHIF